MKKFRVLSTALAAAAFLAGCGGSNPGNQSPAVGFTRMVNFGDSLSDVGTYKTDIIAANGGGLYSINGDFSKAGLLYTNWTQYLAGTLQLTQPCAAEVGLDSVADLAFLAQQPEAVTTCFNFAEGGARVTNPVGPGNNVLYTMFGATSGELGQLTIPVTTQIDNFTANNTFTSTDLVTVLAGGNDLLLNRGVNVDGFVQQIEGAVQAGQLTQDEANVQISADVDAQVAAMTQAGTDLAALVTTKILAGGATHVVVVNLPDVSLTPDNAIWVAGPVGLIVEPLHPHLTLDMTNAFNAALAAGLSIDTTTQTSADAKVVWVDAFGASDMQAANPDAYGLTNVTAPACDLTKTGLSIPNVGLVPLASSLFCTKNSLIAPDTAHVTATDPTGVMAYEYADTVHPTPYGYRLLAELVGLKMSVKGWL